MSSVAPAAETCQTFARVYCSKLEDCAAYEFRSEFGDATRCVERWAAFCARTQGLPGSGFAEANAKQCSAALKAWSCPRFRPLADIMIPACHPNGTKPIDARCAHDSQCQTGYCLLEFPASSECGYCAPRAKSNGECWGGMPGTPKQGCQLGEVCTRGFCAGPLKNAGEACRMATPWTSDCYGDSPAGEWLSCAGPPPRPDAVGVCRRFGDVASCSRSFDCEPAGWCHAGRCEPRPWQTLGAACSAEHDLCLASNCVDGRCTAYPSAGDACDDERRCSFPFVCAGGTCRLSDASCQ